MPLDVCSIHTRGTMTTRKSVVATPYITPDAMFKLMKFAGKPSVEQHVNANKEDKDIQLAKVKTALFLGRFTKEVLKERLRQIDKFNDQSHLPDKSESIGDFVPNEQEAKAVCDTVFRFGKGTWFHIHFEEFCEAWCASNPQDMRKELVQLIATLTAHVQAIDERGL